jgi:hypothetical protein
MFYFLSCLGEFRLVLGVIFGVILNIFYILDFSVDFL